MPTEPSHPSAFARVARVAASALGQPAAFAGAMLLIVTWAVVGPIFGFSDTWQLVINTTTTIVTFLMVFLIQNTQNRDALAMHLKLDELIRVTQGARNASLDMEELSEQELDELRGRYQALAIRARELAEREEGTGVPDFEAVAEDVETAAADADAQTVEALQSAKRHVARTSPNGAADGALDRSGAG